MIDTRLFYFINGMAGKIAVIDRFFKGISNDYFAAITCCLILLWLWFGTRDPAKRDINQRAVLVAAISIGLTNLLVFISNTLYFRTRPFDMLPVYDINLLFYRPTDPSFPSNLAAVLFAIAIPIFMKNKGWGIVLLVIATLASFGRVYMGIHYPFDILGGAAVGVIGAFLALGTARLITPLINLIMKFLRKISLA
jgi:undecaprenyl-diphosphatase